MHGLGWRRGLVTALVPLVTACGSTMKSQAPAVPEAPPGSTPTVARTNSSEIQTSQPVAAADDPVLALITESDRHFAAGQAELEQGHFEGAKEEFNRAVGVLLESPYGARNEPRIREHFDRLVDRISTFEVQALAAGDGFAEKSYEPASIDELLALSTTFGTPDATPELTDVVQQDLRRATPDIPIPLNRRVLSYIELFQGRLHDFIEDGMGLGW